MKKILKLYRMMVRSNRASGAETGKKISSTYVTVVLGAVLTVAAGVLAFKYAELLELFGGAPILVMVLGVLAAVLIISFSIFTLINTMYMSSDIEILITLPFSSTEIALLRVFPVLQMSMIGTICGLFAPMIGYSLVCPVSAQEWIACAFAAILTPLLVLSLTASAVTIVMSFLKIFRNRNALRSIGIVLLFVFYCGYLFVSSSGDSLDKEAILKSAVWLSSIVKYLVPPVSFATKYMTTGNVLDLLYALASTAAAMLLFFFLTKALYLKGALNMQDAGSGKVLSDEDLKKKCRKKTPLQALIAKEFYMVRRNPAYLLGNFIFGLLWPVIIVISFKQMIPIIQEAVADGSIASLFSKGFEFSAFSTMSVILSFVMLMLVTMPLMTQTLAASSLSREGDSFYIMKQLPVSYATQLQAKKSMAETIAQLSVTGYSALILIAVSYLLKFSILYCIVPLVMVMLYCKLVVYTDMYIGILNANVTWDNEKKAAEKPGWALLIELGYLVVIIAAAAGIFIAMFNSILSESICLVLTLVLGILMAGASVLLWKKILVDGEKKIRRLRF